MIERIFQVMDYMEAQKVHSGTHMLENEAGDGWINTRQRLNDANK